MIKMKPDLKLPGLESEVDETSNTVKDIVDNKKQSDVNGNTRPMYDVVRHMRGKQVNINHFCCVFLSSLRQTSAILG